MAFFELPPAGKSFVHGFDTQKAFRAPIGAISPLWVAFAGATSAGLAFWWMSRLMRPLNLEAYLFKADGAPQLALAPPEEPAVEAVIEDVPEPTAAPANVTFVEAVLAESEPPLAAAPKSLVEAMSEPVIEPTPTSMAAPATKPALAKTATAPAKSSSTMSTKAAPKKRS